MRDPKRIDRILKLIKKIWKKNPGLRLCQLIDNCTYLYKEDSYYIEDNIIEERLKEVYLDAKPFTLKDLKKVKKAFQKKMKDLYNV